METKWNDNGRGKTEELREQPVPVLVCPPHITSVSFIDVRNIKQARKSASKGYR
jgi:hypothetical protein